MSITQTSKIQVRSGNLDNLPQLAVGEIAFTTDTKQLFIGNDAGSVSVLPNNTEILTVFSDIPAPGITGDVLFNNDGIMSVASNLNPNATFTYDALGGTSGNGLLTVEEMSVLGTANLGVVSDVIILGGASGQVLSTDGSGSLSWITVAGGSTTSITNGTSNVSMPAADGNVNTSVGGVANVFVVTSAGANVTGNLDVTGNITGSNLTLTGNLSLPAGSTFAADDISATGNIVAVGNVSGGNLATAGDLTVTGNGAITGNVSAGNIITTGNIDGGNLSITGKSTLGAVGNITITGGISGQVLTTDGTGVLSWTTVGSSGISNGTSSVSVPTIDGNVNISVGPNSNVLVVTQTGANVAGTFNATGNIVGSNIDTSGSVTASTIISNVATGTAPFTVTSTTLVANLKSESALSATTAETVTTNAQPNITSVGTLTSVSVSGTSDLGAVGNITITGGTSGQVLTTNGSGSLSWSTVGTSSLSNGTSGVTIPTLDGNVNTSVGGVANVFVVTSTGANVTGTLDITGNANVGNLGTAGILATGDVTIGGNLTVNGTTTTVNSNVVTINDRALTVANNATTRALADSSGFIVADSNFASFLYRSGTNSFESSQTIIAPDIKTTTLTANGAVSLGSVANLSVTGGATGQVLTTDGAGVLTWSTITGGVSNGTSSVTIPTVNSNVNITVAGTNRIIATTVGANIVGSLTTTTITTGANTTAGTITGNFTLTTGSRLNATYADLAEKYASDDDYPPGTLVMIGGAAEVTIATHDGRHRLAGIVSSEPAYVLNSTISNSIIVALTGRVPCLVTGNISKGEMLTVSNIDGVATSVQQPEHGIIIGRALQSYNSDQIGTIEVKVDRG